uniref:Uncharacterized protein n=1 Tax=virus sp. ctkyY8 TaxID=2827995 RepID=A0A8S5REM7_9VIRU|nr:MAG TPA: hypothetical protein [virus sp. ctkyY8]
MHSYAISANLLPPFLLFLLPRFPLTFRHHLIIFLKIFNHFSLIILKWYL